MLSKKRFKVGIAQINPVCGDIKGNYNKIMTAIDNAQNGGADILFISPLPLSGINIGDMSYNSDFTSSIGKTIQDLAKKSNIKVVLTIPNSSDFQVLSLGAGVVENFTKIDIDIHHHIIPFGRESVMSEPGIHLKALGGFDDNVYTGGTTIINPDGNRVYQMRYFEEDFVILEFENRIDGCFCLTENDFAIYEKEEFLWQVLMLGLRDYVAKSGFKKVLLGMSGGMDSAFVAALAVDALGAENVYGYILPSRYSSDLSERLARLQCEKLKINVDKIQIEPIFNAFEKELSNSFKGHEQDVTEENLQSRIRGTILMSISNKFGWLLLTTGNKSEAAVGYTTLYGDSCGGFNPIKDVYKTDIYRLAKWRNCHKPDLSMGEIEEVIVEDIINRPPTAELRDNQKDSDSLPDYPVLDTILCELIENGKSPTQLYASFSQEMVDKVYALMLKSQFKRTQSAPGTNITKKSLKDLKLPQSFRYNLI